MHYSAIIPFNGKSKKIIFEAENDEEALQIACKANAYVDGPALEPKIPEVLCYDVKTAKRLLGNISTSTLYRWLTLGYVERTKYAGKILITRRSVERFSLQTRS